MTKDHIEQMLQRLGKALSTGDPKGVSSCWEVPALVLSDAGATAVSSMGEIETFFAQAIEWYRSQGLTSTRPELERVEALSDQLAAVDVRWLALDASGKEQSSEHSHYILQLGKDGKVSIRVALTRTP